MPVPGYENKIEFGVLVHFAYPVEDSGEVPLKDINFSQVQIFYYVRAYRMM